LLCSWEKTLNAILHLPVVVAQPDESMQTEQFLH